MKLSLILLHFLITVFSKLKKLIKNRNIPGNENNSGTNERDTLDLLNLKLYNPEEKSASIK